MVRQKLTPSKRQNLPLCRETRVLTIRNITKLLLPVRPPWFSTQKTRLTTSFPLWEKKNHSTFRIAKKKLLECPYRGASETPKNYHPVRPSQKRRLEQGKQHGYSLESRFEQRGFLKDRVQEHNLEHEPSKYQKNETKIDVRTRPEVVDEGIENRHLGVKRMHNLEDFGSDVVSNRVDRPVPTRDRIKKLSVVHLMKGIFTDLDYGFHCRFQTDQQEKPPTFEFSGLNLGKNTIEADESKFPGVNNVINFMLKTHSDSEDKLTIRTDFIHQLDDICREIHSNSIFRGMISQNEFSTKSVKDRHSFYKEIFKNKDNGCLFWGKIEGGIKIFSIQRKVDNKISVHKEKLILFYLIYVAMINEISLDEDSEFKTNTPGILEKFN